MSDQNDISKKLEETLNNYGDVLEKCTKAMEDNTKFNKENITKINELVKKIKDRIFKCNEKLKLINDNRKIFDESKQEKEKQLKAAIEESKLNNEQRMRELQEKQRLQEEENRRKIAEIESKSKSELEETQRKLNKQHKNELQVKIDALTKSQENTAALEERQKEAQLELESIKEENNRQKAANERDIQTKKNELEGAKKSLKENQEKLESIMIGIADKDKKIEALNNQVTNLNKKLEEQIREAEGRIEQLGEEKNKIIEEKTAAIEDLNNKHNIRIKELGEEHEKQIEELTNNLTAEFERQKQEAIEQTEKSIQAAADEKLSASNTTTQNLQEQIDQCNTDKENFTKQLTNAQATINELTSKYDNVEGNNFDELTKSVDDIGNNEVKQLEDLLSEADAVIKESGDIAGTDPSKQDDEVPNLPVPKLESDDDGEKQASTETVGQQEGEDIGNGWKKYIEQSSGDPYYYNAETGESVWNDPREGKAKADDEEHPLEIDKTVKQNALSKFKLIKNAIKAKRGFHDAEEKLDFKNMLVGKGDDKGIIDAYTRRITHGELDKLIERIVDSKLHGMGKMISSAFKRKLKTVIDKSTEHHKQHHKLMKRMLESMVMRDSTYYQNIANEIDRVGFEKTFEQLLTAFHLAWGVRDIADLYRFGHDSSHGHTEEVLQQVGKVAMTLWATPFHEYEDVKSMKEARVHIQNDKTNKYAYYHKHDHKGNVAFAGGFRHGKRSKKQNKRSLKSKLMAKKFSLKSKKKGKNKSKKRRKSIKIRIN